jgi:cupin fold WbuC family metalloprotein
MEIGGLVRVSPSVFESTADPVVVSKGEIDALIAAAREAPDGRARILLHPDREDSLHEMVIALPHDSCDHPHINFKSGKSFLALSGQFAVMRCADDGSQIEPIVLSAGGWPGGRIVRLRAPAWHTIIPLQGDTVFLETIAGPFPGNRFADWSPRRDDAAARAAAVERFRPAARAAARRLELAERI